MFQRLIACFIVCFPAFAQVSLPLPAELVGAPGQPVSAVADLNLGATGVYIFEPSPSPVGGNNPPKMIQNLQTGSVLGSVPNVAPGKTFPYKAGDKIQIHIFGILPSSNCGAETVTLTFRNVLAQVVLQKKVTFRCFAAKASFTVRNARAGSGTPADPARFCGAGGAVRIDGTSSSTASTYEIDVQELNGTAKTTRVLTPAEKLDIGDFDLRRVVPQHFFEGGKSYRITLRTKPAIAEATRVIAFDTATPAFRMIDKDGKVRVANHAGQGDAAAPITVCPGKVIMDAASTTCESKFHLAVQESDAWWNRNDKLEWERWFLGREAQDGMNLDELIAAHPEALKKAAKKPFQIAGMPVSILKSVPRYFRIGLTTMEQPWDSRWLLVRTGTEAECATERVSPDTFNANPCPRTADIPWPQLQSELARLFLTPCTFAPGCLGASERTYWPGMKGPHYNVEPTWVGTLPASNVADLATQDAIVAEMKRMADAHAPMCEKTGEKKVPVDVRLHLDVVNGKQRVNMGVFYACCAKLF